MKIKSTRKELLENNEVFSAGYCDLQSLLYGLDPYGYNCGIYGWNWDCYYLGNNVTVVTGYRNLCGKPIPHQLIRIYENKAKKIIKHDSYEEQQELLNRLRNQFIETLKTL